MKTDWMKPALFAVVACLLACGCDVAGVQVVGSGHSATETRPVTAFDQIDISGRGKLVFRQGAADTLQIQADDNILPILTSTVEDHTLHLGTRNNTSVSTRTPIVYTVTSKELRAVHLSGSLTARIESLDTDRLDVGLSGSGDVVVTGKVPAQSINISGSGSYDGAACPGQTATISISGSGHVVVNVTEKLDATISGSGDVEYLGHPSVNSHISGSGHVSARS